MRLTSKTAYGMTALYDMAYHGSANGSARPVQAREVAERQGIPLRYLEQILQELRRAGFVEAKRGPGGGYALARAPETIRLAEVITTLEGPIDSLLSFETRAEVTGVGRDGAEVLSSVWRQLAERLAGLLAGITLKDLVTRAEALGVARAAAAPQMYFI